MDRELIGRETEREEISTASCTRKRLTAKSREILRRNPAEQTEQRACVFLVGFAIWRRRPTACRPPK